MKTKTFLLTIILLTAFLAMDQPYHSAISNGTGAPAGNTGSPFDAKTCARSGCHPSPATALSGILTSNIPGTGYLPGTTYTITCSVSQAGINKWGFQVSPMNNAGVLQGNLVITNPTTTKIVSGKYVTHTAGGTAGAGSKTWSFNWVAPLAGTGNVTFYGAFNFTNNNNMPTGDVIHTSTLTVAEDLTSGVEESAGDLVLANVHPNPFHDVLHVSYGIRKQEPVIISVYNSSGELLLKSEKGHLISGNYQESLSIDPGLPKGIYFVTIQAGIDRLTKKVVKF